MPPSNTPETAVNTPGRGQGAQILRRAKQWHVRRIRAIAVRMKGGALAENAVMRSRE